MHCLDKFRFYLGDVTEEVEAFAAGLPEMQDVPILLLNGTADTVTPIHMSRELARLLPQAEFVEFEGVTHMGSISLRNQAKPIFERYCTFLNRRI